MVRISGGQLKGRRIASKKILIKPGKSELRPTSAKVREAIFDILREEIKDATFLDLYAGTGTVGIEALSRGAGRVVLVEKDQVRSRAIIHYLKETGLSDRAEVHREKAEYFLRRASVAGATFDIIFADPPYASDELRKVIALMNDYDILIGGGPLIVEHSSKALLPEHAGKLRFVKNYRYGDTMLTFFRKSS